MKFLTRDDSRKEEDALELAIKLREVMKDDFKFVDKIRSVQLGLPTKEIEKDISEAIMRTRTRKSP